MSQPIKIKCHSIHLRNKYKTKNKGTKVASVNTKILINLTKTCDISALKL
jgi:hypothetical protein